MIKIDNLIKFYGDRKILEIENLEIRDFEKVALIGNNGVGKTTLINLILGREGLDEGNIFSENILFIDNIFKNQITEKALSPGEFSKREIIKNSDNNKFLLIDEPTANLDIYAIEKVVNILKNRKSGFLIVSHDRNFIDNTCNKIIEIVDGKIYEYNGNYSRYLEIKSLENTRKEREYNQYVNEKKRLKNIVNHLVGVRDSMRDVPKRMGNSEARLNKMATQVSKKKVDNNIKAVKSRIERLEVKEKPVEDEIIKLTISESERIKSKFLIFGDRIHKKFGDNIIFKNTEFKIDSFSKYAIIGKNGSGKSTLIKMILDGENIKKHEKLKIGYFSQTNEILDFNKNILENIREVSIYDETTNRIVLARLLFKRDDIFKKISILSEGEKSKVKLAKLLLGNYNLLIFDEITNFLDINSIIEIQKLLSNYDRPIIFVSHDIEFIDSVATKLLIIEDFKITEFLGNYREFKNKKSIDSKNLLLETKLSGIISMLSMENISKDKKEELEREYKKIIEEKNSK